MIPNTLGKYKFDFLAGIKNPPIRLITTGCEKISSSSYYLDNSKREECYLFQYTLSGSGTVVVKGERYEVEKGRAFLLKMPDEDKYYFDENEKDPWHFVYVRFKGNGCRDYYNHIVENAGNIISLCENSKSILSLFEIYRRASLGLITDSFTCERLAFDFLCKLCFDATNKEEDLSDLVVNAKKIMDTDFANVGGIFDVAQRLGVSQSHLSRVFTCETKQSPIEYLVRVRLKEAVNMLNDGNESVENIAIKCGFSCGNYFCKVFRKYMEVSPAEYRKRIKPSLYSSVVI